MKYLTLILAFVILTSFASAQSDTLGMFKQGETINLLQVCSNCSYNNVSAIVYPNSSIIYINKLMTKNGINYNYTLVSSLVNQVGTYTIVGIGDDDGIESGWVYTFEVTKSGFEQSLTGAFANLFFLFFLSAFFLALALIIDSNKMLLKMATLAFALMFLLMAGNLGMDYYYGEKSASMMFYSFVIALVSGFGIITYLFISYFVSIFKAVKEARKIEETELL